MKTSADIKMYFQKLTRKQIVSFIIFLCAAIFAYLMAKYGEQVQKIGYVVLIAELLILTLITWGMAGHTVMKVLFGVSVGLSLLIYLAQSYCDVPATLRTSTSNSALMSLIGFGIIYIGFDYLRLLRKEIMDRLKTLSEINNHKRPWLVVVPYGLFTGLFTWQVVQVLVPIINSLCVYTR